MAIFGQIQRSELGTKYTHYGWFCGVCPVYLGNLGSEAPTVAERNWVPEWWMGFTELLFGTYAMLRTSIDPEYEPMYPLAISGEL